MNYNFVTRINLHYIVENLTNKLCSFRYFEETWITGFYSERWSVFERIIRTNNDAEGWHHRINGRINARNSFYTTIELLRSEADLIDLQVQYVYFILLYMHICIYIITL